jgi:iron complex transport system ATP-binding protein
VSALVSLTDVRVRLGAQEIVRGVSLKVSAGEIAALVGANGAGKSTLLRAALGILAPSAGEALLGDRSAHALSPRGRAALVAYLPQNPEAAWPISVFNLAALGRFAFGAAPHRMSQTDRAAIDRALAFTRMEDLQQRPVTALSGGERTRAHLARALAQAAPLLILDEPTASLDPAHALAVLDAMRAHVSGGGGVLFTTHDVAFAARAANAVHVMYEGRVIAAGAPADALTPASLAQAYGRAGKLAVLDGVPAAVFS